jgi:hypothetical protein
MLSLILIEMRWFRGVAQSVRKDSGNFKHAVKLPQIRLSALSTASTEAVATSSLIPTP